MGEVDWLGGLGKATPKKLAKTAIGLFALGVGIAVVSSVWGDLFD